jgi:transposase-like protein
VNTLTGRSEVACQCALLRLHTQFFERTVRRLFHDETLKKLLWLAQKDIAKKWIMPIPSWGDIIAEFAVMFPERIKI